MNLSDFNNLDFNNIASWPLPARAVAVGLVFVLVIGAGYWFDTRSQLDTLHEAQRQEQGLKTQIMVLAGQAANLEAYKKQLVEIRHTFGEMLQQLPNRTEVAGLLVDISQAGLASGLEFELFKPEAEIHKEFYAELPIDIRVTGGFHQFGKFVSDIAALPRIVTLHNISIQSAGKTGKLVMNMTAMTYRYLEPGETSAKPKGKKK